MPYITKERRDAIWGDSVTDYDTQLRTSGELNYYISYICNEYLQHKGLSYATINDIVGALEGAKLEYYRRIAAPHEDQKIKVNGDVY